MSNCTFQAQLMSIMEILAKAAVAEINRRVNDSCAVIRLEMRRSQRDIDALKRKYHVMENELRRTRGRARKRGPTVMISDRYTPTPRSVCIQNRVCGWSDEHNTDLTEQRQPLPLQDTTVPHPSSETVHLIKEETEEGNLWSREEDQVTFSHQGPERATPVEDTDMSHAAPDEPSTLTHGTHTGEQEVTLEVRVKTEEEEDEEAKEGGGIKDDEEEDRKEDRTDGELPEEQQEQQDLGQGQFVLEQHGGASLWSATTCDFNTDAYTHTQSVSDPQLPPPPPPPPLIGSTSAIEQSGNAAILIGRNTGLGRWGVQGNRQVHDSDHMTREPGISRSQVGFRTGGGPALGQGSFRGNCSSNGIGGFSNTATTAVGFQSGALRRFRPHQWRSVGATAGSSSSSSSSSSSLHAERRGYICSFCPKSFARLSQLKEHLRSHTGEKPFSCATCGRRFTKHCNLVRHAVVHSGEKPYRCPTCAKCFTQSSSLKSHQRTHLMPHHREGALVSRAQFRGSLLSGAGTSQSYRGFT